MKENLKKNQAITLVSLVVTIIILIILAGVSINLILGKDGIITIAKQAKENTELAKIEEETALNELYYQISETGDSSISYDNIEALVEFKKEIASAITDMGIETSASANATTMASNIRSISGASSADKVSYDNANSGLTANNMQGAIDEVNDNLTDNLVWRNSDIIDTSYSFEAKTININLSKYRFVEIVFLDNRNSLTIQQIVKVKKGTSHKLHYIFINSYNNLVEYRRECSVSENSITFSDALDLYIGGTTTTVNHWLIPYEIYGII